MTVVNADVSERGELPGDLPVPDPGRGPGVCLVGPGWTFTSGVSYYTCRLANAMAESHDTSVIQLRRLLPRRLYPGWKRVGLQRASMAYSEDVRVYNGIDWWWGRSLIGALNFLRAQRPGVLVLEWWTAATLHTYLVLAVVARVLGLRVVIELHELQGAGRQALRPVGSARAAPALARVRGPLEIRLAAARGVLRVPQPGCGGRGTRPVRPVRSRSRRRQSRRPGRDLRRQDSTQAGGRQPPFLWPDPAV